MLMYLYGADTYRRTNKLREIIDKYREKYPDGNVTRLDAEDDDALARLTSFTGSQGLFAKASLAVLSGVEELGEKEQRVFAKFLKEQREAPQATIIVVADRALPKPFAFLLDDDVKPASGDKEFEAFGEREQLSYLKKEATRLGLSVSDTQIREVAALFPEDTWGAMTELATVASGGQARALTTSIDFIGLIRTLTATGRLRERLRALMLLLKYEEPAKVFNMLAAFAGGSQKVKMADYDIAVKSGKLEYAEALLEYVLAPTSEIPSSRVAG